MSWDDALFAPDGLPQGLAAADGAIAARFGVYRNNVMSSLATALEDGFPTVARLTGQAFFRAMAVAFVRAHPPGSPILARYGEAFPDFLSDFPPIAHLPYLPDVARLELALRHAYHAADAPPVPQAALSNPEIGTARLGLAPAVAVLSSRYPIHAIWRRNHDDRAPKPTPGAQSVLVTRPDWDALAEPVPDAEATFIDRLSRMPLAEAADLPTLDLPRALARLVARKAIVCVEYAA
ncbi:DNA-binding domain-containing protein [Maritimibacter sp. DP1N21-5]|uniref:HvfC/BufC N-terminal domain-containing protein n=1 Tax=Maritimibacter sp. DP1N21-5 TaxID=2836867 RepID=UPI001C48B862|nr:DNA-binding domain-containing protein [Maritimibacter sp. DP1N21-5]MBV7410287.1 putative DNA-binding domain-containing protein [Maritimibacter sp. DP1N21-5]